MDAILLCMKKKGIRFFGSVRFPNTNVSRFYEKTAFLAKLRSRRSNYDNVLIMAHGWHDSILTTTRNPDHPYRKYIDCNDVGAFENNFIFAVSCLTANTFGRKCVERGSIAYLGYQVEIGYLFSADPSPESCVPGSVITSINTLIKHVFVESLSKSYEDFLQNPVSVKLLRMRFAFEVEKRLSMILEMTPKEIHDRYNIKIADRHYATYVANLILRTIENLNEILPRLICVGDENYISSTFIRYRKEAGLSSEEILQELECNQSFNNLQHEKYKSYLRELTVS